MFITYNSIFLPVNLLRTWSLVHGEQSHRTQHAIFYGLFNTFNNHVVKILDLKRKANRVHLLPRISSLNLKFKIVLACFWFILFIVNSLINIIFLILKLTFTFASFLILLGELYVVKLFVKKMIWLSWKDTGFGEIEVHILPLSISVALDKLFNSLNLSSLLCNMGRIIPIWRTIVKIRTN